MYEFNSNLQKLPERVESYVNWLPYCEKIFFVLIISSKLSVIVRRYFQNFIKLYKICHQKFYRNVPGTFSTFRIFSKFFKTHLTLSTLLSVDCCGTNST